MKSTDRSANFFLLGCSRSGTTLLASLLNSHPDILVPPETWWFSTVKELGQANIRSKIWYKVLMHRVHGFLQSSQDPKIVELIPIFLGKNNHFVGHYSELFLKLIEEIKTQRNIMVVGEKTPAHSTYMEEINTYYSSMNKVILLRDPRDIVCSYFNAWFKHDLNSLYKILMIIKVYLHNLLYVADGSIIKIKYEDLTQFPDKELSKIFKFVGVKAVELNQLKKQSTIVAEGIHSNIDKPIMKNQGNYKNQLSKEFILLIEKLLLKEMIKMDYISTYSREELSIYTLPLEFNNFQTDFENSIITEKREKSSCNWKVRGLKKYKYLVKYLIGK